MRKVLLLSENDLKQLRQATVSGREISVTRALRDQAMTASTSKAAPAWSCDMLIRLEQNNGRVYSSQYFVSVEEMMRYI